MRANYIERFQKLHEEHLQLEGLVGSGEEDKTLIGYVARIIPILEEVDRANKEDITQTTFLAKNLLHRVKTQLETEVPAQFGEVWSRIDSENEKSKMYRGQVDATFK